MQALEIEREAFHRLPAIVADLFDDLSTATVAVEQMPPDRGIDLVVENGKGQRFLIEVKSSSSPGVVAHSAERLAKTAPRDGLPVLVVPYMTAGGAKAAAERGLSWIDLSGNAYLRDEGLYVSVLGRPNRFASPGRPSSPFAPKSSRVARAMLLNPTRWWLQKELAEHTGLDRGRISRLVKRLDQDALVERDGPHLRPREPDLLLDAWAQDYRFDRHDIVTGHLSGNGIELARDVHDHLRRSQIDHAFTGLPAAWAIDPFARFRLVSVYVEADPRTAAAETGMRRNERGANVQLIGPDDPGVFDGRQAFDELPCVSPVQTFLDLGHLPERAIEAADHLRADRRLWDGD